MSPELRNSDGETPTDAQETLVEYLLTEEQRTSLEPYELVAWAISSEAIQRPFNFSDQREKELLLEIIEAKTGLNAKAAMEARKELQHRGYVTHKVNPAAPHHLWLQLTNSGQRALSNKMAAIGAVERHFVPTLYESE